MPNALIVDDEADLCKLMQMTLSRMGLHSDVAYDLAGATALFAQNTYDFCLTDLALPDGSGLDLVKTIVASEHPIPVAVITAHGTVDAAIEALKLGAFDFVNKPLEISRLRLLVQNALKVEQEDNQSSSESSEDKLLNERLIGNSPPMLELRKTIKKVAKSQAPVFLSGASGTGKEVVAKLIHDLSPRREGSFVPVNCGAIPSELVESEFFGHKKGSFTGATSDKIGLFAQASGGTLFLDEVADLPLVMQVKLLRAIQEKTVRAVGDTKEVPVDVRILSATHKDLNKLVQEGLFRQDLFYRINVIMVPLPLLNDRREDIVLLADHFLRLISEDWGIEVPALSQEAKEALQTHNFEGNVRELRNMLERAITMSEHQEIDHTHLLGTPAPKEEVSPPKVAVKYGQSYANYSQEEQLRTQKLHSIGYFVGDGAMTSSPKQSDKTDKESLPKEGLEAYLQETEKRLIINALEIAGGSKTNAAKLLGMSFRSLRYRMKKLEIDHDDD